MSAVGPVCDTGTRDGGVVPSISIAEAHDSTSRLSHPTNNGCKLSEQDRREIKGRSKPSQSMIEAESSKIDIEPTSKQDITRSNQPRLK